MLLKEMEPFQPRRISLTTRTYDHWDHWYSANELFGIDFVARIPGFRQAGEQVPSVDPNYIFDRETTRAILAGFTFNKRVLLQGAHGSGKSSHIEQIAARLNWPCLRINLDSQINRLDLIGRDIISLQDDKQVTSFQEGMLPWAMQQPMALIFDEYDAGRPDVMFVIHRLLEAEGKLTLLETNRVIHPHSAFRIFATCNTVGLGDTTGLYHGSQLINQAQMDRWQLIAQLNYLSRDEEIHILCARLPEYRQSDRKAQLENMVLLASLTRNGFRQGDLSTVMSLRTLLTWAENQLIFDDLGLTFRLSFLNRCDPEERLILAEYYQRCFGEELSLTEGERGSA
jgi:cobaltochelatase CobS